MNWVFTLLLSLTCAVSISSSSQEKTFTIDALKYHEDTTKKLSFEDILSATDSLLISNPNYQPSLYHSSSAYWIKLDFCIKHDEEQYLMEFYDQTIDSISLFVSKNGLEFKKYQFGSSYNFDDKPFQHKNFEVFLGGEGNYVAYARIVSRNYVDIRVAVRSINRFINYALNEYYLYGL
ncbi:MAG: 7TM-DISM domain-containing protein, partial [Bacteroidota bacterium]